jgi:hypothetical protein
MFRSDLSFSHTARIGDLFILRNEFRLWSQCTKPMHHVFATARWTSFWTKNPGIGETKSTVLQVYHSPGQPGHVTLTGLSVACCLAGDCILQEHGRADLGGDTDSAASIENYRNSMWSNFM